MTDGVVLSGQQNFASIIEQLESLTESDGEYFSHQTALYLLGLQPEPPATLTIVADRRRRNRVIGGFELVFVFHGTEENSFTQNIAFLGKHLRVSTIEKTLVDLTKDCSYAPPVAEVARLFCSVSYNLRTLLSIARQTSDSVLKRVSLYLAWSGRAVYSELPLKLFKRTPVKLDPAEEENLIWNGLFNCRLPAALLLQPPALPPDDVDRETRLWMELRHLPEFCEKQAASGMIFIRQSPEPRIKAIIENYFIEIFRNLSSEKLEWLLNNGLNAIERPDFPPLIPRMLVSFITGRSDVLGLRMPEITEWVRNSLNSNDLGRAEAAIYFGALAGLDDEVIRRFEELSQQLFYGGRFAIINFFAGHYLSRGIKLSHTAYIDISKTYSAQERFEESLNLLEEAKLQYEDSHDSSLGHIFYAASLVLKRLNRDDEALAELFLARETFVLLNDFEWLARTENSLGNIYFSRGHPQSARLHYHSGLHLARRHGLKTLLPSFLANIGLVEFDTGNFARARLQLSQAYGLYKSQGNIWNASVTGMGLGKLFLKLGHFFKAMKIFREVLVMREEKKNLSGIYEIYSLLSWICEILGKTAAAKTWIDNAEMLKQQNRLELRACHVGQTLLAMSHIYNMRLSDAETLYRRMLAEAVNRDAPGIQIGDLQYGLASVLLFQGREIEGREMLLAARKNIGADSERIQFVQLNIITALYFPGAVNKLDLGQQLQKFQNSGCYDPFWAHIAGRLKSQGSTEATEYLKFHISRTPPGMMKHLFSQFKGLKNLVNELLPGNSRAGEFFTLLSRDNTRTMHYEEYLAWQKNLPAGTLVFDAPAGQLFYSGNRAALKAGSIPHSVLLQLFMAQPHPVEIDTMYRSAWGTNFDPEFDTGAFKSTVQRLKKLLQSLAPSTRITTGKTRNGGRGVKLSLAVPWKVIFK